MGYEFSDYSEKLSRALLSIPDEVSKEEKKAILNNRLENLRFLINESVYQTVINGTSKYTPTSVLGRLSRVRLEPNLTLSSAFGFATFENGEELIYISPLLVLGYFYTKRSPIFKEFLSTESVPFIVEEEFGEEVVQIVREFVKETKATNNNFYAILYLTFVHETLHIIFQHVYENTLKDSITGTTDPREIDMTDIVLNYALDVFINTTILSTGSYYILSSHNPKIPRKAPPLSPSEFFTEIENKTWMSTDSVREVIDSINTLLGPFMPPRGIGIVPSSLSGEQEKKEIVDIYSSLGDEFGKRFAKLASEFLPLFDAKEVVKRGLHKVDDIQLLDEVKSLFHLETGEFVHSAMQAAIKELIGEDVNGYSYVPVEDFLQKYGNSLSKLDVLVVVFLLRPLFEEHLASSFLSFDESSQKVIVQDLIRFYTIPSELFAWVIKYYINSNSSMSANSTCESSSNNNKSEGRVDGNTEEDLEEKLSRDNVSIDDLAREISSVYSNGKLAGIVSSLASRSVSVQEKEIPLFTNLLNRFVSIVSLHSDESSTRSFAKRSRREISLGSNGTLILPGEVGRTVEKVAVIVDTSGSMGEEEISRSVSVVLGSMKKFPQAEFTILWNDADYKKEVFMGSDYKSVEKLLNERGVFGGGGSVFTNSLTDISVINADFLVFISDLFIFVDMPKRKKLPPMLIIHTDIDTFVDKGLVNAISVDNSIVQKFAKSSKTAFYTTLSSFKI